MISSNFYFVLHANVLLYILRAIVKNSVGRNSIERERDHEENMMSGSSSSNNNSIMKIVGNGTANSRFLIK